jgi:ribA/ribD-fused uncharacterized protein
MDKYMDKCSYFIENLALFGSSPCQEFVNYLEDELGIKYFVDLTYDNEPNIDGYTTRYTKIKHPIKDQKIPTNRLEFCKFILTLDDILRRGGKMYVHCKGGHGRSGVVVASVLGVYYGLSAEKALEMTHASHQKRKVMRDRWRMIGSPQTYAQKEFIRQLFYPIYYNTYGNFEYKYLSTFSSHRVKMEIKGIGMVDFPTAEAAYQAHKAPQELYVESQSKAPTPKISKILGKHSPIVGNWEEIRDDVMYRVLLAKFTQNAEIRTLLIETGLRPIFKSSKRISYWNNMEFNRMGLLLQRVRKELVLSC